MGKRSLEGQEKHREQPACVHAAIHIKPLLFKQRDLLHQRNCTRKSKKL